MTPPRSQSCCPKSCQLATLEHLCSRSRKHRFARSGGSPGPSSGSRPGPLPSKKRGGNPLPARSLKWFSRSSNRTVHRIRPATRRLPPTPTLPHLGGGGEDQGAEAGLLLMPLCSASNEKISSPRQRPASSGPAVPPCAPVQDFRRPSRQKDPAASQDRPQGACCQSFAR